MHYPTMVIKLQIWVWCFVLLPTWEPGSWQRFTRLSVERHCSKLGQEAHFKLSAKRTNAESANLVNHSRRVWPYPRFFFWESAAPVRFRSLNSSRWIVQLGRYRRISECFGARRDAWLNGRSIHTSGTLSRKSSRVIPNSEYPDLWGIPLTTERFISKNIPGYSPRLKRCFQFSWGFCSRKVGTDRVILVYRLLIVWNFQALQF